MVLAMARALLNLTMLMEIPTLPDPHPAMETVPGRILNENYNQVTLLSSATGDSLSGGSLSICLNGAVLDAKLRSRSQAEIVRLSQGRLQ